MDPYGGRMKKMSERIRLDPFSLQFFVGEKEIGLENRTCQTPVICLKLDRSQRS